jgi:beta-1,4-mannosyltransferase
MGDVDRSPRILNHALSIANNTPYSVDLIGYRGNSMPASIKEDKRIRMRYLSTQLVDKLKQMPKALYLLYAFLRIIINIVQLLYVLLNERYEHILIQNPPCMPLFFVCYLVKKIRGNETKIIIDWHNYGYSIMRVNGVNKFVLFIAKFYEQKFGKAIGDYNLCVSKAMSVDLTNHFMLSNVTVLYDAATKKF